MDTEVNNGRFLKSRYVYFTLHFTPNYEFRQGEGEETECRIHTNNFSYNPCNLKLVPILSSWFTPVFGKHLFSAVLWGANLALNF